MNPDHNYLDQLHFTPENSHQPEAKEAVPAKRSPKRSGWNIKTSFWVVSLSVLPLLGIGLFSLWREFQVQRDKAVKDQEFQGQFLAEGLSRFLAERATDLQTLATLPTFISPSSGDSTQNDHREMLARFLRSQSMFETTVLVDTNGNILSAASTGAPSEGNFNNVPYLQEALKTRKPVVSPPQKSKNTGRYAIWVAAPILEADRTIGALIGRISIHKLTEEFTRQHPTAGDRFFIDGNGLVVESSNPKAVGQSIDKTFPRFSSALSSPTLSLQAASDGADFLATYSPVRSASETANQPSTSASNHTSNHKWGILLSQREFDFQKAYWQWLLIYAGTIALTTLLTGVLATLLIRRSQQPALQATAALKELNQGNLDIRLPMEGNTQAGILSAQINRVAEHLQSLMQHRQIENKRARFLRDLSQQMVQATQPRERLKILTETLRLHLSTDRVIVIRLDSTLLATIVAESVGLGWPQTLGLQFNDFCLAQDNVIDQYRQGRIQTITNLQEDTRQSQCYVEQLDPLGVQAKISVPILVNQQLLGLLVVHHCQSPRAWEPTEIDLLEQVATQLELTWEQTPDDLTAQLATMQQAALQANTHVQADQIAVRQLSERVFQQSHDVVRVLAAIQARIQAVQPLDTCVQQVSELAQTVSTVTTEGETATAQMVQNTLRLRQTVAETLRRVKHLGESTQRISIALARFNKIAQRTNLLVVNATLARQSGGGNEGFELIAKEVGDLTSLSATAIRDLETIVDHIQEETRSVSEVLDRSTQYVVEGTGLVDTTQHHVRQMGEVSEQVDQLFGAIGELSDSQTQMLQEIFQWVQDLADNSQQTSDRSRQLFQAFQKTAIVMQQWQGRVQGESIQTGGQGNGIHESHYTEHDVERQLPSSPADVWV